MPTLALFDVDGTLVMTEGCGKRALQRAFAEVYGLADALAGVDLAGRTDPSIVREVCDRHGLQVWRADLFWPAYFGHLADECARAPGQALPGVAGLLQACAARSDLCLALGTGNVERGARTKLAPFDLNRYFPTGGFGDDGENRTELIAAGIRRAEEYYGQQFDAVWVVGDTPRDVASGKANAASTLAVATGWHSTDQLAAAGADRVVADLTATESIVSLLVT